MILNPGNLKFKNELDLLSEAHIRRLERAIKFQFRKAYITVKKIYV